MSAAVAVSGASGRIGATVTAALADAGVTVRALSRKPASLPGPGATYADFNDHGSLLAALDGVERALLLTPDDRPAQQATLEAAFCRAAVEAGVSHVVKVSAYLAGLPEPVSFGIHQRAAEQAVEASGLIYTHLRPAFFMQSLALFAADVRGANRLIAPTRGGAVAFVDLRDVADCAAAILTAGGFENQAFTVTGSEALSFQTVAERMSRVFQRPIAYRGVPRPAARLLLTLRERMSWEYAGLITGMFAAIDRGAEATVHDAVQTITGRAPRRLDDWLAEQRDSFTAPA